MRFLIVSFFLLASFQISSGQNKKVVGYYLSNFAEAGFFVTQIQLYNDGTFKYESWGDMADNQANGKYIYIKDTIYLTYNPEIEKIDNIDTLRYTYLDSNGNKFKPKHPFKIIRPVTFGPKKLYFRNKKLFFIDSHGKIEKAMKHEKIGESRWQMKMRKYYLLKRDFPWINTHDHSH